MIVCMMFQGGSQYAVRGRLRCAADTLLYYILRHEPTEFRISTIVFQETRLTAPRRPTSGARSARSVCPYEDDETVGRAVSLHVVDVPPVDRGPVALVRGVMGSPYTNML
jgi:hypothetical protein